MSENGYGDVSCEFKASLLPKHSLRVLHEGKCLFNKAPSSEQIDEVNKITKS